MNLETVFKTLLTSSILGSILVIFILLVSATFKKILSPTFKYYIWLLLLIKLVYPFGPINNLNIFTAVSKVQNVVIGTNEANNFLIIQGNINENFARVDKEGSTKFSSETSKSFININSIKGKGNYVQIFSRIWIAGVFIISLYIFIGITKVSKIKKNKSYIAQIDRSVIIECCKILNIKREIDIVFTDKVDTPSIVGLFKPIILMPLNILNILSIDKFKFVVLHELIHYKRKDMYLNLMIIALVCFYWFNPIIIYGLYKMRQCREVSCDALVLTLLENDARLEYGYTIIELAEKSFRNNLIPNNGLNFIIKSDLKRRVSMIKEYKKMNKYSILAGLIIVLVVGFLGLSNTSAKNQQMSANSTIIDEVYKSKINASNKLEFWNRIQSKVNNDIFKVSNEIIPDIEPFSSNIVIYNSHSIESYQSGPTVIDVGISINEKLTKDNIQSNFLKVAPSENYGDSYQVSRDLITSKVKEYDKTVLLDIHRDSSTNQRSDTKTILLVLAKGNPGYEENKKFADKLYQEIKNSTKVKVNYQLYESYELKSGFFNQDLSKKSVLIEIGNEKSSDQEIKECIDVLVSALKTAQNSSIKQ